MSIRVIEQSCHRIEYLDIAHCKHIDKSSARFGGYFQCITNNSIRAPTHLNLNLQSLDIDRSKKLTDTTICNFTHLRLNPKMSNVEINDDHVHPWVNTDMGSGSEDELMGGRTSCRATTPP
ncbi:3557_t:CDS:2 [Entrophospora sp. SA101]|nr:3557_t:CDS:2 [Entrophospora sp. SA101]CAJ0908844.1 2852_t:CDS:2 [Entrophospora sp. SA101]